MNAEGILNTLQGQGLHLSADGDTLRVTPRERLTDQTRAIIKQNKPDLLKLLTGKNVGELPPTAQEPIPGRLSAPIPPSMRQWDYQRGCWLGGDPARQPKRGSMGAVRRLP